MILSLKSEGDSVAEWVPSVSDFSKYKFLVYRKLTNKQVITSKLYTAKYPIGGDGIAIQPIMPNQIYFMAEWQT